MLMTAQTLKDKTVMALEKELDEALNHVKELRFKISANQLKNVRDVRKTRQVIAQIRTALAEKKIEKEQT
jgi:ribosomal protein L29